MHYKRPMLIRKCMYVIILHMSWFISKYLHPAPRKPRLGSKFPSRHANISQTSTLAPSNHCFFLGPILTHQYSFMHANRSSPSDDLCQQRPHPQPYLVLQSNEHGRPCQLRHFPQHCPAAGGRTVSTGPAEGEPAGRAPEISLGGGQWQAQLPSPSKTLSLEKWHAVVLTWARALAPASLQGRALSPGPLTGGAPMSAGPAPPYGTGVALSRHVSGGGGSPCMGLPQQQLPGAHRRHVDTS